MMINSSVLGTVSHQTKLINIQPYSVSLLKIMRYVKKQVVSDLSFCTTAAEQWQLVL